MRNYIIGIVPHYCDTLAASAMEFTAPVAPESAQPYMPGSEETFAQGLWHILKSAIAAVHPELVDAAGICLSVIIITLLLSLLNNFGKDAALPLRLTGAVILGLLLLGPIDTLIHLGADTVRELSDYCKLLLPVMTSALAAQGGATASAALYAGTALFNAILSAVITGLIVPALYIFLCFSMAFCAFEQELLKKIRDLVKWAMTWLLKWTLYIFTGYITITGVISGTVDTSVLKAAKIGISGAVPVVGGILSDATETILVSAGLMKNAAGVYGIFTALSICVAPFIKIGVPYLLLKCTGGITDTFGYKPAATLVQDFSTGMGMMLAMTGSVCVLLMVSLVCFMKGIG